MPPQRHWGPTGSDSGHELPPAAEGLDRSLDTDGKSNEKKRARVSPESSAESHEGAPHSDRPDEEAAALWVFENGKGKRAMLSEAALRARESFGGVSQAPAKTKVQTWIAAVEDDFIARANVKKEDVSSPSGNADGSQRAAREKTSKERKADKRLEMKMAKQGQTYMPKGEKNNLENLAARCGLNINVISEAERRQVQIVAALASRRMSVCGKTSTVETGLSIKTERGVQDGKTGTFIETEFSARQRHFA